MLDIIHTDFLKRGLDIVLEDLHSLLKHFKKKLFLKILITKTSSEFLSSYGRTRGGKTSFSHPFLLV